MIEMPNMLMIAGNARNIGKTTLACAVIERFADALRINGLKVTSIRQGEDNYHGRHISLSSGSFTIVEEHDAAIPKDTARMLRAGAYNSYFMQVADAHLDEAAQYVAGFFPSGVPVICESRSLRKEIKPGLFVFLQNDSDNLHIKKESFFREIADVVIDCTPGDHDTFNLADKIIFYNNRWIINN
jgi:hypothetical protein